MGEYQVAKTRADAEALNEEMEPPVLTENETKQIAYEQQAQRLQTGLEAVAFAEEAGYGLDDLQEFLADNGAPTDAIAARLEALKADNPQFGER